MLRPSLFTLISLSFAMVSGSALALPDDRNQPISGQADTMHMDQKTGIATYSGNVNLMQGSLNIRADVIHVHMDSKNTITKITASGKPARFSQQPSLEQKVVNATASEITYSPTEERLLLIENAEIEQDGQKLNAPRIDYDLIKEVMKADQVGEKRVDIFIPARTNQPKNAN